MKTEQEQIKEIKQIIDERVETNLGQVQGRHDNVIKTVDTVIIARDIIDAGYGDVPEYKAEIERLKADRNDYKQRYESAKNEYESLVRSSTEAIMKKDRSRKNDIKQAQVDVLSKLKTYSRCDNFFKDGKWHRYVFIDDIDELIKEVEKQ